VAGAPPRDPFDLLRRPDLAEALEASRGDLQHAAQKISAPEAIERRASKPGQGSCAA